MLESLKVWLASVRFACEVQNVISMRRVLLARGEPQAAGEARRMIAGGRDACADAEAVIATALAHGEALMVAAERACAPMRRWVRANDRRLLRALGSDIREAAN